MIIFLLEFHFSQSFTVTHLLHYFNPLWSPPSRRRILDSGRRHPRPGANLALYLLPYTLCSFPNFHLLRQLQSIAANAPCGLTQRKRIRVSYSIHYTVTDYSFLSRYHISPSCLFTQDLASGYPLSPGK
ncbi:hypothetical protein BJY01DRAFT_210874 [Aspergillus pseudoustus]|uniref:Uncharacterized protein n=1 Tax=Aspergillus pseudoustus TaxID=1810923 RepID=A0ABR4KD95_9EURO